jgi:hypothetical protein
MVGLQEAKMVTIGGSAVRMLSLLLGIVSMCLLFAAATAQAKFWGSGGTCYRGGSETHHCYAIEEFNMKGYPTEYGDGVVLFMDTISMEVPGWKSNDFVDDEVWLIFGENDYIETGQTAGNERNCCTLYSFYAWTLHGVQLEYINPSPAPGNTYNDHYEIWDPCHCGSWGIWYGGNGNGTGEEVWAIGREYPAWSKALEGGMEAAANVQPYNWGRDEVATVEPPTDYWTEWLSGYGNHSYPNVSPHQCVSRNPESNHYGNIAFSTCVIEN